MSSSTILWYGYGYPQAYPKITRKCTHKAPYDINIHNLNTQYQDTQINIQEYQYPNQGQNIPIQNQYK